MNIKSFIFIVVGTALLAILLARAAAALSVLVTTNSGLSFGQLIATPVPGTVTVTPAGARIASGGVALGNGLGVAAAVFTVTGDPNASYSITLPVAATLSGRGSSMTVDTFTSNPSGSGNLGARGTQTVAVGATLHVGATQRPAAHSGTYAISVSYN